MQDRKWLIPLLLFLRFAFAVIGIVLLVLLTQSTENELLQYYCLIILVAGAMCILRLFLEREQTYRPGTGHKLECALLTSMGIEQYISKEFNAHIPAYRVIKKQSKHDIRKNTPVYIFQIEYWTQ